MEVYEKANLVMMVRTLALEAILAGTVLALALTLRAILPGGAPGCWARAGRIAVASVVRPSSAERTSGWGNRRAATR
jgi:hypothetical protein